MIALAVATIALAVASQSTAHVSARLTDSQMAQLRGYERQLAGPDIRSAPVAFGFVNSNGSKASGSGNVTSSYDSTFGRYVIHINAVNYFYSSISTTVTPSIPNTTCTACRTDSVAGNMLVICYNLAGSQIQAAFGFITF